MEDEKTKIKRSYVLNRTSYDPKSYEYDPSFKPWDGGDPLGVHTTAEMVEALRRNPNIELDANVIHLKAAQDGLSAKVKPISKKTLLESFDKDIGKNIRLREFNSFGEGGFSANGSLGNTLVGQDFTPLVGGPFYKNLYFYQDYIRMHAEAFYSYHNDPFAHAITAITRDFVLGTGYEMQTDTSTRQGKLAIAAWKAFEEANELQDQMDHACEELSIYGEIMFWKLPGNNAKITYNLTKNDTRPIALIPRVRLIDPSNIVEIVTYPEDITRPLFYVWLQPTQYQIYTGGMYGNQPTSEPIQPTLKFIYRQIPADQMLHTKINAVSNEKRGRSDYFPVFNYLKRLRDSVDYALIGLEKTSAWSIDTAVDGDQTDIDNYIRSQQALGTIPPAGSEFVHSKAIERQYLGNNHAGGHSSDVFQWALSCIAAGVGIPVSYFGTHLSGAGTRASALVSTEPVAKKMEKRREVMKRLLKKLWDYCQQQAGLGMVEVNIVFPELITQDRSQKLKDLLLMERARWIKPERAGTLAAKEMAIQNYSYEEELKDIEEQLPEIPLPLTDPGNLSQPDVVEPTGGAQGGGSEEKVPLSGLSSTDKKGIKDDVATL